MPGDGLRPADYLGALILLIGIAGEALADAQLRAFRTDPANKGRVCDVGLWRWSRHPNYFFEWFGWLAYPVIGISFSDPLSYPWGFAALLGPVFMYWILVYVTGIPPLEAADAALARRSLSRLPVAHQPVLSAAAAKHDPDPSGGAARISEAGFRSRQTRVVSADDVSAAIRRLCSRTAMPAKRNRRTRPCRVRWPDARLSMSNRDI